MIAPSSSPIPCSPARCKVAEVTRLGRGLDLEARAAPRKKVVAKKVIAKQARGSKKIVAPKKAVAASKKAPKKAATKTGKGAKVAEPDFCELPVKGAKGGKVVQGTRLVKRGCVRTPILSGNALCTVPLIRLRFHRRAPDLSTPRLLQLTWRLLSNRSASTIVHLLLAGGSDQERMVLPLRSKGNLA